MHESHVTRRFRLGQNDGVESLTGLGDDLDNVIVAPGRAHIVDTNAQCLRMPRQILEGIDH